MPYVINQKRKEMQGDASHEGRDPRDSGELAFALCDVINKFLQDNPNGGFEGAISKVSGAIEATRVAFEQDVMIPYEAIKRQENGRVFADWPHRHESQ